MRFFAALRMTGDGRIVMMRGLAIRNDGGQLGMTRGMTTSYDMIITAIIEGEERKNAQAFGCAL